MSSAEPPSAGTTPADGQGNSQSSPKSTAKDAKNTPATTNGNAAHHTNSANNSHLNPRSCVTCRKRKVRCNKENPCSNCVRANIDCIFPGPGRAPRRSKKPHEAELLARLRRIEGAVKQLGAQVDENGVVVQNNIPITSPAASVQRDPSQEVDRSDSKRNSLDKALGRLVISEDRSRYVSNQFWASMGDEIAEMRDLLDNSSSEEEDEYDSPGQERFVSHQGFLFGYSSLSVDLKPLHPTPTQIFILWEVFKENVDPVVKILHRPTAKNILINASSNLDRVSKSAEALLFAIYFGAVVSLTDDQCEELLKDSKDQLMRKYRFATEQALARADFMNSSSLMCLQAFVFFLVFVRHVDDSRLVWALGGLAIHIAQALGIHRDGSNFNLSPFDTEMKRRLWWHVSLLDNRASEDHGTDPTFSEQFYDTKLPLNVNDDDIWPDMKEAPRERTGATEVTFGLIRFELSVFSRRLNFTAPGADPTRAKIQTLTEKEAMIDSCHRKIEEKYLKHCDMSVPIFWVCATVARLILAKMWLMVHHPRSMSQDESGRPLPAGVKDRLFITSIEVIEFSCLLERNENTAKWGWLFRTYMQWQSVAFVLSELCVRPGGPVIDRAWRAIESVYDNRVTNSSTKYQRGMLWKPMRHLMAKAKARRAQIAEESGRMSEMKVELQTSPPEQLDDWTSSFPMGTILTATAEAFDLDLNSIFSPQSQNEMQRYAMSTEHMQTPAGLSIPQSDDMNMSVSPQPTDFPNTDYLDWNNWNTGMGVGVGDFNVMPEQPLRFFNNQAQQEWY